MNDMTSSPSPDKPNQTSPRADFVTMGCRLNIAETEAMKKLVPEDSDVVVVNSCAVTNEAVRQTRQAIRKSRKQRPDARIIVTGCAAQIHPDMFAEMDEVDQVIGNREKLSAQSFAFGDANDTRVRVADIMRVTETTPHMASAFADHSRAFVEVQNGCDHRCTFCIIP